jgi:hypothetical protein
VNLLLAYYSELLCESISICLHAAEVNPRLQSVYLKHGVTGRDLADWPRKRLPALSLQFIIVEELN